MAVKKRLYVRRGTGDRMIPQGFKPTVKHSVGKI